MRLQQSLLWLLAFITTIHALALPASIQDFSNSAHDLFKRKGGGGGGGRGGGGFSSGGGSRGGSSSSSGGSRGGSGSRGSGLTSSSSSRGGSTARGSGAPRRFGGGSYYGGGASVPYSAGARRGGVAPFLLGGAALGVLPGLWLYGAYAYHYPGQYTWHNDTTGENQTGAVDCLCGQYSTCGCDANNNTDYLNSVANNDTISRVAPNGTLYINGTLPNGTTAPGGEGAASSLNGGLLQMGGYAALVAGVTYTISFM